MQQNRRIRRWCSDYGAHDVFCGLPPALEDFGAGATDVERKPPIGSMDRAFACFPAPVHIVETNHYRPRVESKAYAQCLESAFFSAPKKRQKARMIARRGPSDYFL